MKKIFTLIAVALCAMSASAEGTTFAYAVGDTPGSDVTSVAGIVPVIEVFVAKGVPIGTALAFMMAVVGLSLPEATMLKKVMTWRLISIFFGTITLFIILLGYLYNMVL